MSTAQEITARAKNALLGTFTLAVLPNLADALWDLSGPVWTSLRIIASGLFTVALVVFVAVYFSNRRRQHQ